MSNNDLKYRDSLGMVSLEKFNPTISSSFARTSQSFLLTNLSPFQIWRKSCTSIKEIKLQMNKSWRRSCKVQKENASSRENVTCFLSKDLRSVFQRERKFLDQPRELMGSVCTIYGVTQLFPRCLSKKHYISRSNQSPFVKPRVFWCFFPVTQFVGWTLRDAENVTVVCVIRAKKRFRVRQKWLLDFSLFSLIYHRWIFHIIEACHTIYHCIKIVIIFPCV